MLDENYWQAVLTRDTRQDGTFVYGVRSTKIFCRPSCPSRRPNREQVIFFNIPEAAEDAGFRQCMRCRPKEENEKVAMVRQACRYMEENLEGSVTLTELGQELNISPFHLQRLFRRIMGITPHQYSEALRLNNLKSRLKEGDNVTNALYEAGYSSSSRLYEGSNAQLGMTPAAYRKGGEGLLINYSVSPCYLGYLLVAATEKGVCSVTLGDNPAELAATLQTGFPLATLSLDSGELSGWVSSILRYLEGAEPHLDLPLDIQATAFQKRVWEELQAIPYGTTRSYGEVARLVGNPQASRAVARACATNPVALVIPCHRVVREGGELGGYRWGTERKRRLLEAEKKVAN